MGAEWTQEAIYHVMDHRKKKSVHWKRITILANYEKNKPLEKG